MSVRFLILAGALVGLAAPGVRAQQLPEPYRTLDARMQPPADSTRAIGPLIRYIRATFATDEERSWAACSWVARTLRFDAENMNTAEFSREPAEIVTEALSTRQGIGVDFAELYAALANGLGLRTYVVTGFGKTPAGALLPGQHAWCASRIGGQWYLLDPSWVAGRVGPGRFEPQLSRTYFQLAPAEFVRTHLPFDPMWQLLPAPYSLTQFQRGTRPDTPPQPWAWADSVAAFDRLSYLQQLHASSRRALLTDPTNGLIRMHQYANKAREQQYQQAGRMRQIAEYNRAQQLTQQAVDQLNAFFTYYNHQFKPAKTDAQLRQQLPPIAASFAQARSILTQLHFDETERQAQADALLASILTGEERLRNSQAFLTRYLRTAPAQRPILFTTRGGPNEMTRSASGPKR